MLAMSLNSSIVRCDDEPSRRRDRLEVVDEDRCELAVAVQDEPYLLRRHTTTNGVVPRAADRRQAMFVHKRAMSEQR